ncbi:unnamed protein product [Pylaiella littoralis]
MAATDELTIDVRIEPPTSAGGGDEEQEQQEQDEDEYSQLVERLRSLVFSQDQDIDEIRRLIITRLPESACGEEDSIAPIRANLWSAMLLGLRPEDLNVQQALVSRSLHGRSSEEDHAAGLMHFPKEDQRVLAADIKRTRQAYAMFKREEVMQLVSQILERYCVGHGIRYKQGQNELIAPFVMLQDPPLPLPVLGLLFESFMSRFVSRWFVDDEIEALLVSYRVFRVLLFYVDPGLACKLDEAEFVPELYATAWLITLFSRNLSMELVVRLWDVYLAVNDPALVFFLLAALLVRNRETILRVEEAHMMPETIQSLTVTDKNDLEELIVQAREMLRKIPANFLQTVRSCCSDQCNAPLDTSRSLFCESVRCASISPGELLERMTTRRRETHDEAEEGGGGGGGRKGGGSRSPCPMKPGQVDTVALDIRPLHDYESSGVGHLGKSLRLDPYLLEMDYVLEKWLEHFDGAKGTHVCLVDSLDPTTAATASAGARGERSRSSSGGGGGGGSNSNGSGGRSRLGSASIPPQPQPLQWRNKSSGNPSNDGKSGSNNAKPTTGLRNIIEDPLWRRLLFGEGESATTTTAAAATSRGTGRADAADADRAELSGNNSNDSGKYRGRAGRTAADGEGDADSREGFGAARAFAQKLHARGFPYVSILEGGMEGIVEHLEREGSPLEPTVIDHDPEAYQRWREAQAHRLAAAQPPEGGQAASRAGKAFSWGGMRARSTSDVTDSSNDRDRDRSGFAAYREDKQQGHPGGARGGGRVGERPGGAGGAGGVGDEGGGAVERSASGAEPARVGVLDRLGLVRVRDGVSFGVETVARTGSWAVRSGAGMIIPSSSLSMDSLDAGGGGRGGGDQQMETRNEGHARTPSGYIWRGEEVLDFDAAGGGGGGGGSGGGSNDAVRGAPVDDNNGDVKAILGAIKTAQAGVRDSITRGVRTGALAVKEGAGRIINSSSSSPSSASANANSNANANSTNVFDEENGMTRAGDGLGKARGQLASSMSAGNGSGRLGEGEENRERRVAIGQECDVDDTNEDKLLVALKTAEHPLGTTWANCLCAAKALRSRLAFVRGQALRIGLNGGRKAGSEDGGSSSSNSNSTSVPSSDTQQFDGTLAA